MVSYQKDLLVVSKKIIKYLGFESLEGSSFFITSWRTANVKDVLYLGGSGGFLSALMIK